MQYLIISLLCLIILLQIIMLFTKRDKLNLDIYDKIINTLKDSCKDNSSNIYKLELSNQKNMSSLANSLVGVMKEQEIKNIKNQNEFKDALSNRINDYNKELSNSIDKLNNKVEQRLQDGFMKNDKTFLEITRRLQIIDSAQQQMSKLSVNISSLQDVLTDKKSRGTFGEVQLNNILVSTFGEKQDLYKLQHTLINNTKVDALLNLPQPLGDICIDSKFPLENYQRMFNNDLSSNEKIEAKKKFKIDVKKHISDISLKYIIEGVTSPQAVMFIPSEAIFAEINAYHEDIIAYSNKQSVWLASPTTLMSMLSTICVVLKNIERDKYSKQIHEELIKLADDFKRYKNRWETLTKNITNVNNSVLELNITNKKITDKFDKISSAKIDELEYIE